MESNTPNKTIGTPIRKDGDKDNRFCIFAIRINGDNTTGQRKLKSDVPYYLMQGFKIENELVYIDKSLITFLNADMYGQYFTYMTKYKPSINISAIVGENGSGKSTIVEYIIRLINNLAASVFGEMKTSDSSERLHYVDGMNGELFYMQYGRVYSIQVINASAKLTVYEPDIKKCTDKIDVQKPAGTFYNNYRPVDNLKHALFQPSTSTDSMNHLFYTIVSNHSMYAYNTNDYKSEIDTVKNESEADLWYKKHIADQKRINKVTKFPADQRCWIHGLFHKNDGYQIPIVLTPCRKEGTININTEYELAKERLVSLIVDNKSNFHIINDHLKIESLTIKRSDKRYDYAKFRQKLRINMISKETYRYIRKSIKDAWWETLELPEELGINKKYYEDAVDYLTYKTIKVSRQYPQYRWFYLQFKKANWQFEESDIKELINKLLLDSSHITAKIYQTIAYLAYDIYSDSIIAQPVIPETIKKLGKKASSNYIDIEGLKLYNLQKNKMIPAPIFSISINLKDTYTRDSVPFETLSSGEKQLCYAVSSLLYHLVNIESVNDDNNHIRVKYDHVNIILEEIELYFHPELQKRFVKYLLDSLNSLVFENLKGLNIIIVTHSPFVLSDIPSTNILAINKDGSPRHGVQSFGANIHEMLADSFFLNNGSIGDYAQWYINSLIEAIESDKVITDPIELHRRIMIIDEPVIRMTLLNQYRNKYKNIDSRLREIELLKELEQIRKGNVEA